MSRPFSWLLLLCSVAAVPHAYGDIVVRDWLTQGDGLLTVDLANGQEWLDVPQSLLAQFDPVDEVNALNLAIAQTEQGGLFEGFQLATRSDVLDLLRTAGVDTTVPNSTSDAANARFLANALGETFAGRVVVGVIDEILLDDMVDNQIANASFMLLVDPPTQNNPEGVRSFTIGRFGDTGISVVDNAGLMLVRNIVPEAHTFWLAVVAIASSLTRRSYL